jgi:hypothetical protein
MSTGTGNLPNQNMDFVPLATLPAADLDKLVDNIESLADGSGIGDGAITSIKTSFGGNYSPSEVNTGFTWVYGKDIWKKTINFGTLPNSTTKTVAHGASLDTLINYECVSVAVSGSRLPLPFVNTNLATTTSYIAMFFDDTNITIVTGNDRSSLSTYVTLYYTKP